MGHADFRVNGRIFASLNRDETRGMVVLTPDQQQRFVEEHPSAFEPESGAWGRSGCTRIHLERVDEETLGEAVTVAWQNSIARGPARAREDGHRYAGRQVHHRQGAADGLPRGESDIRVNAGRPGKPFSA